jgi:hypothetical protein
MTQMQQQTKTQITIFRVEGKDRLSDDWVEFLARWRWQAEEWAERRAFVIRNEDDSFRIEPIQLTSRIRVEWLRNGSWEAESAWYGPEHLEHLEQMVARKNKDAGARWHRIACESSGLVVDA